MKKQLALLAALAMATGVPAGVTTSQSSMGFTATAQSNKVSGVVKDANGEPMIGVNVRVKGTNTGTTTDLDGRYSIKADPNATLVFSYVGYDAMEVPASQAANVQLAEGANTLQDVVVTAEFGMKRVARTVGSSVQNVKAQDIIESGRTDFISALQGRVSGMSVTSSGGAPGASTTVVLRSATSLSGNNQPLYVIDGIPMNNTSFNPTSGLASEDGGLAGLSPRSTDYSSRGNDFNPEDIESMTVLKGAAAAALYGSDASNGAIIITTKKGRSGRARVTYSNQLSWSKAYGWPEIQDKYINGNYGAANFYYTSRYGSLYNGSMPFYDNTKAVLQTGFMHRHNVSMEAGNDKMSIRGSASYFDQDGVIKTTALTRTNLSLSGRAELTKWLAMEGSMQYVNQKNDKALRGLYGPVRYSYRWPSVDDMSNYLAEDGVHMRYPAYYTDTDLLNPLYGLKKNRMHDETDRIISAFSLNFTPIEHTYLRLQLGWDVSTSTYENATHPYYVSANQSVDDSSNKGTYNIVKYNTNDPTLNVLAGYNNTFMNNKFSLGIQAGYHQLENGVTSLSSYGYNFKVIDFYSINNCTESTITSKKRSTKRRIQAISGQLELGFNNMLFLTGRFRNDWSSTLPKDNNSYFYPAGEVSFVVTELPAFKDNAFLSYLKLRGAVAQVGKDAPVLSIDPELQPTGLTGGGYKYGYTGPNKNLKPEMTTSFEAGAEARFWRDRINADFTWFHTHCADQIVTGFRMSYATGFVLNNMNVGTFNTWGWEGHVDMDVIRTNDLRWNVGVNLSHTNSEVVDLPENLTEYYNAYTWNSGNIRNGVMKGSPITTVTGRAYERNDAGQILIDPTTGLPRISSEWSILGNREPKLRFGFTTSLSFKNWRLSAMFQGRYHADVVNATMRDMLGTGLNWLSVEMRESGSVVFDGVLYDGNQNTDNPTKNTIAVNMSQYGSSIYTGGDEDWVQHKINYIRCQELRLAYIVPRAWLSRVTRGVVQNGSIYVSGNDLFTITNYTGTDVAGNTLSAAAGGTGGEGYDCWSLPSPRTYSVGLSVTFGSDDAPVAKAYTGPDVTALNNQINDLRSQLTDAQNSANSRIAQLQNDLDAANRALANCKNDLTAAKNAPAKVVDNSAEYLKILVHFPVNKTAVTADQRPNVERVAAYLKSHPGATCTVRGYASPEGPKDNNERLANGRAASVKDLLINKYGIAANRINAAGAGETNMFDELSWNRVSICEIIVK